MDNIRAKVRGAWASWAAAFGIVLGAIASQAGAEQEVVIAVTGFGAATGELVALLARAALRRVGLWGA